MLVVGSMVGTGIFTTSGLLLRDLGSPVAVLAAWAAGAVVALCGAVAYAELASALPRNGGEYLLLGRIYHPALGFTAALTSLIVGFSAPLAAAALAFGQHLAALAPGVDPRRAGLVLLAAAAAVHAGDVRLGARVQAAATTLVVVLIVLFVGLGLARGEPARLLAGPAPFAALASPAFPAGLVYVVFAYSGWNAAVYLAGEVATPARTLPRALIAGTLLVALLYVGLSAAFLAAAPADRLAGVVEVGHVAAVALLGPAAGQGLSALVALVLASTVSALLMTGPRVYEQVGRDYPALAALGRRNRRGTPATAVSLQALAAAALLLTASFEALLRYVGFTLSITTALAVLGVPVLRWREPALPRPYRAWAYPVSPGLFAATGAWIAWSALRENPGSSWAGLATLAAGLALYRLLGRVSPGARPPRWPRPC